MTEKLREFVLDLNDEGIWLVRIDGKTWPVGKNKQAAIALIEQLNDAHRPNLEMINGVLHICWNTHEKGEACEYVRAVSEDKLSERVRNAPLMMNTGPYHGQAWFNNLADEIADLERELARKDDAIVDGLMKRKDLERRLEEMTEKAFAAKLEKMHAVDDLLDARQRLEAAEKCPYVETSDEGTSYCRLAENNGANPRKAK